MNAHDVRCAVSGLLRGTDGAPCVSSEGYVRCSVWRGEKMRIWRLGRHNRASQFINSGSGEWQPR